MKVSLPQAEGDRDGSMRMAYLPAANYLMAAEASSCLEDARHNVTWAWDDPGSLWQRPQRRLAARSESAWPLHATKHSPFSALLSPALTLHAASPPLDCACRLVSRPWPWP